VKAAPAEALAARASAEELVSAAEVRKAVDQVAVRMTVDLAQTNPVLISVLEGGLAFTGWLLKRLDFPLQTGYVHVGRYGDETTGGQLQWHARPTIKIEDRCVVFIDDILDKGITLTHLREWAFAQGAAQVKVAVLVDKQIPGAQQRPISADFIGLRAPDRFLFGCGMDYQGYWRNLPAIYALAEAK
jgi:hypoxanthine phosphoribosyltransferase